MSTFGEKMAFDNYEEIKCCIFDPTGNITALVETEVRAADRAPVASGIMAAHPEVEQVGFVAYNDAAFAADTGTDAAVSLMMAGGEFCGNATMCAAALYAERRGMPADGAVTVKVSGAEAPLTVQLEEIKGSGACAGSTVNDSPRAAGEVGSTAARQLSDESAAGGASGAAGNETAPAAMYAAAVTMPPAIGIERLELKAGTECSERNGAGPKDGAEFEGAGGAFGLPLVRLQGIDHIIIEPDSGFFGLKDDPAAAESLIRECCGALGSDCLGMMFLDEPEAQAAAQDGQPDAAEAADGCAEKTEAAADCAAPGGTAEREAAGGTAARCDVRRMTPLVFVPGADTLFWENSCASGSAAAGIWLAMKAGSPVDVRLHQPAGSLRVESDPATGRTVLHGTARLLTQNTI